MLATIDHLLRDPADFVKQASAARFAGTARALVMVIAVCGAVFGASLGLYRGGLQILWAAIKLPAVLLFTAALCAPVLTSARRAVGIASDLRADLVLVLCSLAMMSLIAAALSPLLLLGIVWRASYHDLILLTVGMSGVAGLMGLSLFVRGLLTNQSRGRTWVTLILVASYCIVGAQMSWTLRPWLVRPQTRDVPFVRHVEGNFIEAVGRSVESSQGNFYRESAPNPEDLR